MVSKQSIISVPLPQRAYEIVIAPNGLSQLGSRLQSLQVGQKVLLVSNPAIFQHYGESAIASLSAAGFLVAT